MTLPARMYGSRSCPADGRFGLRCGQTHTGSSVTARATWFNEHGARLGWGDIVPADLERIAAGLDEHDMIMIVSEDASFWSFPGRHLPDFDPNRPGFGWVAANAAYAVERGKVYVVTDEHATGDATEVSDDETTLAAEFITRTGLRRKLRALNDD